MRLVSRQINEALDASKSAPANFGLVFNKWLILKDDRGVLKPIVKETKQPLIDSYENSRKEADKLLQITHLRQLSYCQSMEGTGWHSFTIEAELSSTFVSGLGMTHPTETGLVLDHTTGVPYIPAASLKGVMRFAHIINSMLDSDGEWRDLDWLYEQGVVKDEPNKDTSEITQCWQEDKASKTMFGFSIKNDSLAGQLVALDAYPLNTPSLGEEILNPHFQKYYNGNRGPTEDQSPVPVKFLVIKPGTHFVFRLLLRRPLTKALETDQEKLIELVEKNIQRALTEEGIGAKTALGFGRFVIIDKKEPEIVNNWLKRRKEEKEAVKYPWRPLVRKIDEIKEWNWGVFKQKIINNDAIDKYKQEHEVGLIAQTIAKLIKRDNPKKWTADRDKETKEWLSLSGTEWLLNCDPTVDGDKIISTEETKHIEIINNMNDWGAYLQSKLQLENMPRSALKILSQRMKTEWGCSGKKANNDKKKALQKVKALIKS